MGLFRKKKQENISDDAYRWMTVDEALAYSRGEKKISDDALAKLTGELCDQMMFLRTQQEETKEEFSQVTQYLADIQRYEQLGEKERGEVADAARMMLSLDGERTRFQTGPKKLTPAQYHIMEMYENEFPDKLSELEKHEQYMNLVREDMRNLEGEKGSIGYGHDCAIEKQNFLNKLSVAIIFIAIFIFIVLIMLIEKTGKDLTVPFFITGVAAICYIVYYIYAVGECKKEAKKSDYMMNRANVLLNKVKIKYVNTTNVLEYSYDKYHVNSLQELRYIWENYVIQKQEEQRYLKNTQLLNAYTDRLGFTLARAGMEKPDAWIHQPELLLDRGEMVDFRDAIARRRNKLRAQIDFNMRQQDTTMNEIEALKSKYSGREDVINKVLSRNGIE